MFSTVSPAEHSEHPTREAILDLLALTGTATVSILSAELHVPLKRTSYHAGVLEHAGRLERDRGGWLRPKPGPGR
jgi:DNA-binding transcriptional ArsR family regulator